MIKYIIDMGVNLEAADDKGRRPIHYICRYGIVETIQYIVDKNIDMEAETKKGKRAIHYICRYGSSETIKYIIDKNVDLEATDYNGWKPIHYICRYGTFEMIEYIISKNVQSDCKITKYNNHNIDLGIGDLMKMNTNLLISNIEIDSFVCKHKRNMCLIQ